MKDLIENYFAWVTATIGPFLDLIPLNLGWSWLFWLVIFCVLIYPPVEIAIRVNRKLSEEQAAAFEDIGPGSVGHISLRKLLQVSNIVTPESADSQSWSAKQWLWFGYIWQILSLWLFILVLSCLIASA